MKTNPNKYMYIPLKVLSWGQDMNGDKKSRLNNFCDILQILFICQMVTKSLNIRWMSIYISFCSFWTWLIFY